MSRLMKMWILVVLIVLVFAHHFLVHGYLYDESNLISHEVCVMCLVGMMVSLALWGKKK